MPPSIPIISTASGQVVDILRQRVFPGTLHVANGRITKIEETAAAPSTFLLPGFIDAHVHIESSMLVPSEFARLAVLHGTVATISDPHEIANVMGTRACVHDRRCEALAAEVPFRRTQLRARLRVRQIGRRARR